MLKDNHCVNGLTAVQLNDVEKCKYSYTQCLKKRGENLTANRRLMKEQERRNLEGLFKRTSLSRISVKIWSYNHQPFYDKNAEL